MPSDEELAVAVAAGDGRALEELCRRYERPLHAFLFRQTGGRDVDDLYQETWLHAVRGARGFDPRRRFSTWLFQIAVNLCRDAHRRAGAEPVPPDDRRLTGVPGPDDGRDAALDAQRLLAALPEAQRSAVVLRYYHDMPEAEIAAVLGCPAGTVKSRLHQAVARLAALVRDGR